MLKKTVKNKVQQIKDEESSSSSRDSKSKKQTEELLAYFWAEKPVLFRDEMGEAYVQVCRDGKNVIMACESNAFSKYLHYLYWDGTDDLISVENLVKVVKLITVKAEYGDKQCCLHNRVAAFGGDFYYDLGDARAILCGKDRWSVINKVPILFRSFRHQEVQVEPVLNGGDVNLILKYVRIKRDEQQILFLVWLVCAYVPDIPRAILVLFGEKGAAKSTTMRFARMLIDPSKVGLMTLPRSDELVQQLAHNYGAFYDNVNRISQTVSDILCRGVTGAGATKRRLYTDDEDVIYQFMRVIALNGINNVVEAPDLLDRSILIELERILKEDRQTEGELNEMFEKDRPLILGGIFDTLVKAREIFDELDIQEFPRMADFAKWGYAVAEALGFGGEVFLQAYHSNINRQNEEVLENDPVASCICCLMEGRSLWEGTPTELHIQLYDIADKEKLDLRAFPKTPAVLSKRITAVLSNLREVGIEVVRQRDTVNRRGRSFLIEKVSDATDAVDSKPDAAKSDCVGSVGSDGNMQKLEEEAKSLFGEDAISDV